MLERTGGGGERVGGSSGGSAGWVPKVLEANYSPDPTRILQYCPRFYNQVRPPRSPPGSPPGSPGSFCSPGALNSLKAILHCRRLLCTPFHAAPPGLGTHSQYCGCDCS